MAALVLELQREALNPTSSVADLLRMALVVARKLGVSDFEKWVNAELNGYKEGSELPEYRVLHGSLKVWNPYHGWQPLFVKRAKDAERLSKRPSPQSVGELESMLSGSTGKNGPGEFALYFPKEVEQNLMEGMTTPRMQPAVIISGALIQGIIDTVRNTVLDWSLKLEAAGILGQDMTFSSDEKARATTARITYQVQHQTVIHNMHQSQIQQGTTDSTQVFVQPPLDLSAVVQLVNELRSHLDTLNLAPHERAEVEADLTTVEAQKDSPKPRVLIIKEALHSIRAVLENAAGSAAGTALPAILEMLKNLLS